ncbi:hypothetical protein C450_11078 [Halococcus salifodinae DSM 8989]|uniref:CAAX prenyl protease 2/Lysostaphin resistance protein A-like domain-containing protein n=1 Tax=Halococcus salifodinae DSM 8989 TaxID=1227456 RepID=M0N3X8_9EURY|nr:hypothetical protein C450_11078 [Halococcus salifodinae DSM 8989]
MLFLVGIELLAVVGVELSFNSGLTVGLFLFSTLTTQGAMALTAYWYVRRYGFQVSAHTLTAANYRQIVIGTVLALVLALGGNVVIGALFPTEASGAFGGVTALGLPTVLAFGLITIFIVAPAEEFLFRGVIQGRLRETVGAVPSIVGASLLFGGVHVLNYTGSATSIVAHVGLLIVVSFVFAYAYERTGNLTVPILIHGIYDSTLFLLAYVGSVM